MVLGQLFAIVGRWVLEDVQRNSELEYMGPLESIATLTELMLHLNNEWNVSLL